MDSDPLSSASKKRPAGAGIRFSLAIGLGLTISAYLVGIVVGKIQDPQKLRIADVGLLLLSAATVGVLLRPELLDKLTHVKVGSVEFELQKIQDDQQKQQTELDNVRFILTLFLEKSQLKHLKNLDKGETRDYVGNQSLQTELRKLRTLGLIRNCKGRAISEFQDGRKLDLAKIVELTQRGKEYLERLGPYSTGE